MEHTFDPHQEIAYCMGLIVGEGSFTGCTRTPALSVRLHASDPQPLLDLRGVFGGQIYGPYTHNGRTYRQWLLRGVVLLEALPYFERWLPPSRKREQFTAWRERYAAYFERLGKFHDLRSWDTMARRGGGGGILRGSLPDVPTLAGLLIVPDQAGSPKD